MDVDPPYTQDAENFFLNEQDYLRALTGAYDLLQGVYVSYWIGDIASDNTIAGGESVTDTEGLHQIDNMTHGAINKAQKLLSDHKLVLNLKPLTDDKGKFRQWNVKLANVLGQIDEAYGQAIFKIMANIDQGKDADEDLDDPI